MNSNYLQIEKALKECESIELMFKYINGNFKTNQKLSGLHKNMISGQLAKGIKFLGLESKPANKNEK